MKSFIKISAVVMLMLTSMSASAASLITTQFGNFTGPNGEYFLSGVLYSSDRDPVTNEVRGIGTVNEIRDNTNNIVWASGQLGSWVNFVFSDYIINSQGATDPISGATPYTETGGKVSFYDAASNIFNATGDWAVDSANIINNSNAAFATLEGALRIAQAISFSVYGSISPTNVDSHGALNITGGTHGSFFDTNQIPWGNLLSDMSFDFAGTNVNTLGYAYSGTASAKGVLRTVPEPQVLSLMVLGFVIMGVFTRRGSRATALAA